MTQLSDGTTVTTLAGTELVPVVTTPGQVGGNAKITTTNFGLALALRTQSTYLPKAYGAVGDGVTDDTTAIAATITAAAAALKSTVYLPPATYAISGAGVDVPVGIDFIMSDQAILLYTGTGVAVTIDNWHTGVTPDRPGTAVLRVQRSTRTWDTGVDTTSTGILLLNALQSHITIFEVLNFETGIELRGDATATAAGTAYNTIELGRIANNKRNVRFTAVAGGFANSNNFYGGTCRHDSGMASYVGTRGIDLSTTGNGNNFYGTTLEGASTEETATIAQSFNNFYGCRMEVIKRFHFLSTSAGNVVDGGYNNFGYQQTVHRDGTVGAASTAFTSATGTFVAGDVGKLIKIAGAGAAGAMHYTTIAARSSATAITLTDAAITGVGPAVYGYGGPFIDDSSPSTNIVRGSRGSTFVTDGGTFGANAAIVLQAVNSSGDPLIAGKSTDGFTHVQLLANGQLSLYADQLVEGGSLPRVILTPVNGTTVGGFGGLTASRGNAAADATFGRSGATPPGWEANCPIIHHTILQTLGSNGAVTFNASTGEMFVETLNANATSSQLTSVAGTGEVVTISWIQGAAAPFTYAWPANCKFAGGSAPAASTIAGYEDNVTFRYDGANWLEIARAVGVR